LGSNIATRILVSNLKTFDIYKDGKYNYVVLNTDEIRLNDRNGIKDIIKRIILMEIDDDEGSL